MGWEMATLAWGKGGFWDPLLRADGAGEVGRAVLPTFLVVHGRMWGQRTDLWLTNVLQTVARLKAMF